MNTQLDDSSIVPGHWKRWPTSALERIRLPYAWIILLIALLGIASLMVDSILHYQMRGAWPAFEVAFGTVGVVEAVYILLAMRLIKGVSEQALAQLRCSVEIGDQTYDSFARRSLRADGRVEAMLLAAAAVLILVFLVLPPDQLPVLAGRGIVGLIGSVIIALYYVVLFWLLLSLVYIGVRNGRVLSRLARQPLVVNVFDPDRLVPFGRLSLVQSLTFVGVFLIPLVILGPPTRHGGGWLVIGLSVVCLAALFAPLWGVHLQMVKTREKVLTRVCGDLMGIQRSLVDAPAQDADQLRALSGRTEVLFQFRKQILGGPSWPFRNTGSVFRAAIAATSPLIYFILNQLVQTYVFPIFGLK